MDRARAEAQMGSCRRSGFFGIVHKVTLRIVVRIFADNFDGIFIGTDRSVRTETVEYGAHNVVALDGKFLVVRQTCMRNIVINTDGEMIFRRFFFQFIENRFDHCGCKLF